MSLLDDQQSELATPLDIEGFEASEAIPAEAARADEPRVTPPSPVHISELLAKPFPPRAMLLGPWLQEGSSSMLYGQRGIGKSFLSLSIAIAVAGKREFLDWHGTGKFGVLYVDGEMAIDQLQQRVRELAGVEGDTLPIHFMARDWYEQGMPSLNKGLRGAIEKGALQHDVKLVIIDNLSTLWRGAENEAESWDAMQEWIFRLRHRGHSVLLVHHAGKNGSQRGTSRKEDSLDVVVRLGKAASDDATTGAAFNIEFEKTRAQLGDGARSFYARLRDPGSLGLGAWERSAVKLDTEVDEIVASIKDGKTQKEIAAQKGVSASKISRILKKARDNGRFSDGESDEAEEDHTN
jgi:KaiC/GvpD/RAD55 family RecA-like ATPase